MNRFRFLRHRLMFTKAIKIQMPIFIGYLILSSLLLFNHDGGADIGFTFFMGIFQILHFTLVLVRIIRQKEDGLRKILSWYDFLIVILLGTVFWWNLKHYLNLMWYIT